MTARERLRAVLEHRQADRLCVDIGAGPMSGMGASAVHRLRQALLGDHDGRVRVHEPYQMLGEIDEALRQALAVDVVGVHPPATMFGFRTDEGWKPLELMDGTPVLVPERFNITVESDGGWLIYPEGDLSAPPRGRMPPGGHFFDAIIYQEPILEDRLDPADNCEEFQVLGDRDVCYLADTAREFAERTDYGIYLTFPGSGFGDIALVPAPWLRRPKGIRDVEEWYVSLVTRPDYVRAVFDRQLEVAVENLDRLAAALGDNVDVACVTGTDFGTQRGLFISKETYRSLFKPYHVEINRRIHEKTNWKTFIHSCGSVFDLIPDFIEAGFDVLNPVQCSAERMDPATLKREFGSELVFWGGGVDTQRTLPFGTPDEVYRQVRERIDVFFSDGTGFVFSAIHNIQSDVPTENLLALVRALRDARGL